MDLLKLFIIGVYALAFNIGITTLPMAGNEQQAQADQPAKSAINAGISRNWSGYIATDGTFTGVSATWTVPKIKNDIVGIDATWVGIGGVENQDLIQAGTEGIVGQDGQIVYLAFYEALPEPGHKLPVPVNGGDSVTVSVIQQSPGVWYISLHNNTQGISTNFTKSYNSSLSSADWIEEAPSASGNVLPLDNFGTIQINSARTIKNGQTVNLAQANAHALAMGTYGQVLAIASELGNDGASFNVARTNTSYRASQISEVNNQSFDRQPQIILFEGQ